MAEGGGSGNGILRVVLILYKIFKWFGIRLEDIYIVNFSSLQFWMNIKWDIRRMNVKREGNLWMI